MTSSFTDVVEAAGCSADMTGPRCRIVPTFSLANGKVPVSPGPEVPPAPLSACTAAATAELLDDDERATTFGGTAMSAERFSTLAECACFGGTGGGIVDDERRGESSVEVVLDGLVAWSPVPCVFLSVPRAVEVDMPVLLCVRSVRASLAFLKSPPFPFSAVLDRALAEFGRAQLPTDTADIFPSTCVSAADR